MKTYLNVVSRVCIAAALLVAASVPAATLEERGAVDPKGDVEIINVAGSVRVTGWERAEVQVTGEIDGDNRLEFSTQGSRTLVRVVAGNGRGRSAAALVVHIPQLSSLSINTTSADQTIDRIRGRQRLQSVSGSIDTEIGTEDLHVKSISGDIRVRGVGNEAQRVAAMRRVSSVSGDLTLSGIGGELEAETVSGDLDVDATQLTRARINTTNGDLNIAAQLAKDARIDVEAVNGDVRLDLRGRVDAQFNVRTFNGDITSCFGDAQVQTRERGPGSHLDLTQGEGSARVYIKTLNGDVELCAKGR